jgi:hypothetical protein
MNVLKVKRLYEVKKQKKELDDEEEILVKELKEEMLQKNMREAIIGDYQLRLQTQDRSTFGRSIVPFLKETGHSDVIIETYDHDKLKELEKNGLLSEGDLKKHKIERTVVSLYVKPC